MTNLLKDEQVWEKHGQVTKGVCITVPIEYYRVYFLVFCTNYDTQFSKYYIELIVALSSTNPAKMDFLNWISVMWPNCTINKLDFYDVIQSSAHEKTLFTVHVLLQLRTLYHNNIQKLTKVR